MSKEKSPAFQFYVRDWLSDPNRARMSSMQRGWYIDLLCYCWQEMTIPADPAICLSMVESVRFLETLEDTERVAYIDDMQFILNWCFSPHPIDNYFLIHPRLEREREVQELHRAKRSHAGKRGVQVKQSMRNAPPKDEQCSNNGSAFTSSASASASAFPPSPPHEVRGNGNGKLQYDGYNGFPKNLGQTLPLHPLTTDPTAPDYNPKRDPLSAVFQPETQAESDSMIARLCADPIEDI